MASRLLLVTLSVALLCFIPLSAQNVTGSLTATVQDQVGAVVPGVEVNLTNQRTGAVLASRTNAAGIVDYPSLIPGTYVLSIAASGFRTLQVRDVQITANERRSLGVLSLQVGQLQESVQVTAEATPVQTASSERAGLISGEQLLNIAIKGRDPLALLFLPGADEERRSGWPKHSWLLRLRTECQ